MCFGTAGYRTFPNATGPGIEDPANLRLQPSVSAPTTDAGVLALPQAKPPIPPINPRLPVDPINPRPRPIGGPRLYSTY